jgi:hypothetical protein
MFVRALTSREKIRLDELHRTLISSGMSESEWMTTVEKFRKPRGSWRACAALQATLISFGGSTHILGKRC